MAKLIQKGNKMKEFLYSDYAYVGGNKKSGDNDNTNDDIGYGAEWSKKDEARSIINGYSTRYS